MIVVNSSQATALALLQSNGSRTAGDVRPVPVKTAVGLNPISTRALSPGVSDSIFRIAETSRTAGVARPDLVKTTLGLMLNPASDSFHSILDIAKTLMAEKGSLTAGEIKALELYDVAGSNIESRQRIAVSDLPQDAAAQVRKYGADNVIDTRPAQLPDGEFEAFVMDYLKGKFGNDPKFLAAVAAGAVKIERPENVPGLEYTDYQWAMYRGTEMIGGATSHSINADWVSARKDAGIGQSSGLYLGQRYYASWN